MQDYPNTILAILAFLGCIGIGIGGLMARDYWKAWASPERRYAREQDRQRKAIHRTSEEKAEKKSLGDRINIKTVGHVIILLGLLAYLFPQWEIEQKGTLLSIGRCWRFTSDETLEKWTRNIPHEEIEPNGDQLGLEWGLLVGLWILFGIAYENLDVAHRLRYDMAVSRFASKQEPPKNGL